MILITKNKEPKEWTEYRNTPGVDYQAIPELVQSLLKEQGYICAYCMRALVCSIAIFVAKLSHICLLAILSIRFLHFQTMPK